MPPITSTGDFYTDPLLDEPRDSPVAFDLSDRGGLLKLLHDKESVYQSTASVRRPTQDPLQYPSYTHNDGSLLEVSTDLYWRRQPNPAVDDEPDAINLTMHRWSGSKPEYVDIKVSNPIPAHEVRRHFAKREIREHSVNFLSKIGPFCTMMRTQLDADLEADIVPGVVKVTS